MKNRTRNFAAGNEGVDDLGLTDKGLSAAAQGALSLAELSKLRNTVRAMLVPSFAKEGWLRHKETAPFLSWRRRGSCFKPPIIKNCSA